MEPPIETTTPVNQPADTSKSAPIHLTPKAIEMVKATRDQEGMDADTALRVAVRGGGCSGFEYALDFDTQSRENDTVLDFDGLRVFIDAVSARYLKGTEIDFVSGIMGSGFKFKNPNAVGTCGCGSSFSV